MNDRFCFPTTWGLSDSLCWNSRLFWILWLLKSCWSLKRYARASERGTLDPIKLDHLVFTAPDDEQRAEGPPPHSAATSPHIFLSLQFTVLSRVSYRCWVKEHQCNGILSHVTISFIRNYDSLKSPDLLSTPNLEKSQTRWLIMTEARGDCLMRTGGNFWY